MAEKKEFGEVTCETLRCNEIVCRDITCGKLTIQGHFGRSLLGSPSIEIGIETGSSGYIIIYNRDGNRIVEMGLDENEDGTIVTYTPKTLEREETEKQRL